MDEQQAKQIVMAWKRAAPELERVREQDIRAADTVEAMKILGGCIDMAIRDLAPPPDSGLVEMQRYFALARQRESRRDARE